MIQEGYADEKRILDSLLLLNDFEAVATFDRIDRNYNVYYALDAIQDSVAILKNSKAYRNQLKNRSKIQDLEKEISDKFVNRFQEEVQKAQSPNDYRWWKKELKKFDASYKDHSDRSYQKMAKRLRYQFFALAYESSEDHLRYQEYQKALYCDKLLVVLRPENPYSYFRLAQMYARMQKVDDTVGNLEKAISLGYTDLARLKKTKEFEPLLGHQKMKSLFKE